MLAKMVGAKYCANTASLAQTDPDSQHVPPQFGDAERALVVAPQFQVDQQMVQDGTKSRKFGDERETIGHVQKHSVAKKCTNRC
jgi:hypothetical protein